MKGQSSRLFQLLSAGMILVAGVLAAFYFWPRPAWTEDEIATLRSLWIGSLPPLAADPSNRYGDDPAAALLGEKLFFDTRLSANGQWHQDRPHQRGDDRRRGG